MFTQISSIFKNGTRGNIPVNGKQYLLHLSPFCFVLIRKFPASNWILSVFVVGWAWQMMCQVGPWLF
jgi:hypothetical protein